MTTNVQPRTAKIYQFPTRLRAGAGTRRDEAKSAEASFQSMTPVATDSGWYHEAAIQEAERALKR